MKFNGEIKKKKKEKNKDGKSDIIESIKNGK